MKTEKYDAPLERALPTPLKKFVASEDEKRDRRRALAKADGFLDLDHRPATKGACIDLLARARSAFWDAQHAAAQAPRRVRADLCTITAAEVNAWLASLPLDRSDP